MPVLWVKWVTELWVNEPLSQCMWSLGSILPVLGHFNWQIINIIFSFYKNNEFEQNLKSDSWLITHLLIKLIQTLISTGSTQQIPFLPNGCIFIFPYAYEIRLRTDLRKNVFV